jgi:glycerol-3-phosphate cytidylyltransferase
MKPKVGFICGTWDLLHAGHVLALREASFNCQELVVGLQSVPTHKRAPVQGLFERYLQLQAVCYVRDIYPYSDEHDLYNLLESLKPDIRFLGSDYKNISKPITGYHVAPIHYIDRNHQYSTTDLIHRVKESKLYV